jgi:hypothetical protein
MREDTGKHTLLQERICTDYDCSDDLTVEVIFFGSGEKTGKVELNKDASANVSDVAKPKL